MKNLFVSIWMDLETLLAALKQKFLVNPVDFAETKIADTEVAAKQDLNSFKTSLQSDVAKVEAVPSEVGTVVEQAAATVATDVKQGV